MMATRNALVAAFILAMFSMPLNGADTSSRGRLLTEQEVVDLMVGTSIMATRGNNSEGMIRRSIDALKKGMEFRVISIDELPEDATVVSTCGVGGGTPWQHVLDRIKAQGLPTIKPEAVLAAQALGRYLGKEFAAIIQNEPAGSTLAAFLTAAELKIPVVDGCLSGRARPEIQQQIPFVMGIPGTPAALVSLWGDVIYIDTAVDDYRLEDLSRALAISSSGGIWMAQNAMSVPEAQRGIIPGTISQAILYGRTVREAQERGEDPIEALVRVSQGYILFHGVVEKIEYRGELGFHWSDVELRGIGADEGHTYRIFVKNENIMTWRDGQPDAMPPDLICNLDSKTGWALPTWGKNGYPLGQEVLLLGMPAPDQWRTPQGLEILGPRHFGFDVDYIPLEELQERRFKKTRREDIPDVLSTEQLIHPSAKGKSHAGRYPTSDRPVVRQYARQQDRMPKPGT